MIGRDLPIGSIVENIETGRRGVVCPDHSEDGISGCLCCCGDFETPVIYYGSSLLRATKNDLLELIGPENAQADTKKCGVRRSWPWRLFSKKPCAFLIHDEKETEKIVCGRYGKFHLVLDDTDGGRIRVPTSPFPDCQKE